MHITSHYLHLTGLNDMCDYEYTIASLKADIDEAKLLSEHYNY